MEKYDPPQSKYCSRVPENRLERFDIGYHKYRRLLLSKKTTVVTKSTQGLGYKDFALSKSMLNKSNFQKWFFSGSQLCFQPSKSKIRKFFWTLLTLTLHCSDVLMIPMASQNLALRLFTQPFIQAQMKKNIKVPRRWPLCWEFTHDRWIPYTNGQ